MGVYAGSFILFIKVVRAGCEFRIKRETIGTGIDVVTDVLHRGLILLFIKAGFATAAR